MGTSILFYLLFYLLFIVALYIHNNKNQIIKSATMYSEQTPLNTENLNKH
jgi:hypothetical protein